ncbi:hypothetical protein ACFVHW_03990 [Streptomyces sp. NPDC127110]|uniref:hypothetical protein n=1 Tax=Streptomyces sp. NPDC127110 TaxID=3345362 RepID=UPI003638064E
MNLPPQTPSGRHAAKGRILRDLLGLVLGFAGLGGLLGALYSVEPLAALALAAVLLAVTGGGVLYISPPAPPAVRFISGYGALTIGLWILVGIAVYLTPWTLLYGLLLTLGVLLSSEER